MRPSSVIPWALVCAISVALVVLWRDLRAERTEVAELRAQQIQDRLALAEAVRNVPPVALAALEPAVSPPAAPMVRTVPPEVASIATRVAEIVQRETALRAADPELRKARLERARVDVESLYPNLARELGLSDQDADFVFGVLAEGELRSVAEVAGLGPSGSAGLAAVETARLQKQQMDKQRDAITARLGAARFGEIREYVETQPSRTRVTNLSGALSQGGAPLTDAQAKSLMSLLVLEQRRTDLEAQSEPSSSPARITERVFESNRRVLSAVPSFLDPPQVAVIKGRFDRAEAGARAAYAIQERIGVGQGNP